jgi:hypothetical protein
LQVALLLIEVVLNAKTSSILIAKHTGRRRPSEKNATYPHADEVSKLGVGIDIHLDDTIVDSGVDFLLGRAGATMEDKVPDEKRGVRELNNR